MMESLANGNTSWWAANCHQQIAAVATIRIPPKRWEMTCMTECQMGSDELRRQNISGINIRDTSGKEVCMCVCLRICYLKQI